MSFEVMEKTTVCVCVCVHGYAYVAAVHKMQCLVCKQQPVLCHYDHCEAWLKPRLCKTVLQALKNHLLQQRLCTTLLSTGESID